MADGNRRGNFSTRQSLKLGDGEQTARQEGAALEICSTEEKARGRVDRGVQGAVRGLRK